MFLDCEEKTLRSCENLDKISTAIIGATGAVGQRFVQILEGHPWFSLDVLAASGKSAGKKYEESANWVLPQKMPKDVKKKIVLPMDSKKFKDEGIKLVFSALPANIAKEVELTLAENGFFIFSNASAYRMDEEVPLLIADVNGDHLALVEQQKKKREGYIVCNANCSVTGLATGLKPMNQEFGIKSVVVTTYQALSGAGYPGVPSLDISGNVLPYIAREEEKIEKESKKILGKFTGSKIEPSPFFVYPSCARVPVRDGHLESVLVELESAPSLDEIKMAFSKYQGKANGQLPTAPDNPIIVRDEENRPQPLFDVMAGFPKRARGMAISVGRIEKMHEKLRFFLLVHNTIRGAAGCSIMNAELAKAEGFL